MTDRVASVNRPRTGTVVGGTDRRVAPVVPRLASARPGGRLRPVAGRSPMTRSVENAPQAVLAAAKDMLAKGLVEGTAGNISARQVGRHHLCDALIGGLHGDAARRPDDRGPRRQGGVRGPLAVLWSSRSTWPPTGPSTTWGSGDPLPCPSTPPCSRWPVRPDPVVHRRVHHLRGRRRPGHPLRHELGNTGWGRTPSRPWRGGGRP